MIQKFQKSEEIFVHSFDRKTSTTNLENFLINNFLIQGNDLKRICDFISQDVELEKIIYDLPEIISMEFSPNQLSIALDESDEKELNVMIFTDLNGKIAWEKQNIIDNYLFDNYKWDSADKILVCVEFPCLN